MRIKREKLLELAKKFCALAPEKRFCPDYINEDRIEITSNRFGSDRLVLFSSTTTSSVRITMVYRVGRIYEHILVDAGVKNNTRISLDVATTIEDITRGFEQVRLKYNNINTKVKPFLDAYIEKQETVEMAEKNFLAKIGAYTWSRSTHIGGHPIYRQNGKGSVNYNPDGTIDLLLDSLSMEQFDTIIALLGPKVEPKTPTDEIVCKIENLSTEDWDSLTEREKNDYRKSTFSDLYGDKLTEKAGE